MTADDLAAANARLANENERLREQLATVEQYTAQTLVRATRRAQVISVLSHDIELDSLVERTATEIAELFAADVVLFLLGDDHALTVAGHWGVRPADLPPGPFAAPLPADLRPGQPVLIGPTGTVPVPDWLAHYRCRHVAWARLVSGDTSLGLMLLARRAPEPFDESERRELRAIATRVAVAIDNGLLHQRMRRQIDRGQRLHQLMTELAGMLDLEQVAARLAEILVDEVPVEASVIQVERDGELVPLVGTHLRPPAGQRWTQFPLDASGKRVGRIDIAGPPPRDSGGYRLLEHLIGLAAIVIDKAMIYAQSQQQARHDSLTGLLSHRVFHEMLERRIGDGETFSVVLVDIDDFKQVNDFHGHQTGDEALREVAAVLRQGLRTGDSVFRVGGEEFCVVLPGLSGHDAYLTAERLRHQVTSIRTPLALTISLGVASCPLHATNRDELLAAADTALYTSKRTGKNRSTLAGECDGTGAVPPGDLAWLLTLVHRKDPDGLRRGDTAAILAVELGRRLDLSGDRLAALRTAARLHAVGKVGVPDAVLARPGPLTSRDWQVLRTYPLVGAELLRARGLDVPARFVAEHRERRDGGGYPRRLHGGQIARESQVLHVATTWVALRAPRADRPAHGHDHALARLRDLRGGAVEPDVADHATALVTQPSVVP